MRPFRTCVYLFFLLIVSSLVFAIDEELDQETEYQKMLNQRDLPALKEFIIENRGEDLKQKNKDLNISGDVRSVWQNLHEYARGVSLRGGNAVDEDGLPVSNNDIDIQYNFRLDYKTDDSWAVGHLKFDNGAGTGPAARDCDEDPRGCHGSGEGNRINLRQAYIGYKIYANGKQRWDIEIGRRRLYQIYDSYIQFLSRFDGILLRYTREAKRFDFAWKASPFVVDERVNHFAYATEVSFLNIYKTGFDLKYSLIYWPKNGKNRCFVRDPKGWRFINSQITTYYHFPVEQFNTPVDLYAAFLYNHDAPFIGEVENLTVPSLLDPRFAERGLGKIAINSKKNIGWYAGVLWGEVRKKGDFAINLNYQVVQAQAVPDCDVSGISRGNIQDTSFTFDEQGNGNYRGWHLSVLYGLTDRISIDTSFEFSSADDPRLGGTHEYRKFQIELIFAF